MITPNNPPYPAYRATDKNSFAYDSTIRRWPIILDGIITDLQSTIAESSADKAQEGQQLIHAVEQIKSEMAADKQLRYIRLDLVFIFTYFNDRPIEDKEANVKTWNEHLNKWFNGCTWFNGTWLFNECYLYRRVNELFNNSRWWVGYDYFERQKMETFRGSHGAVFELARKMPEVIQPMSEEKLEIVYNELIQVCLWGNATDLSLLTNMSKEDIKRLQAIEKDHLAQRRQYILVDDTPKLWDKLKTMNNGRVDFVLDNSGFEVFVDLILADWLIQSKKAKTVVFNCKTIPWFVSDVMPKDVPMLIDACLDSAFFPCETSQEDFESLKTMVLRWRSYIEEGQLVIRSDDFWCSGLSYWYMKSEAPELFEEMKQSDLVIYKGDLNFRKLVFDCDWPVTTPFKDAIGPSMSKEFTNIITLRTNKADPVVGLSEETKRDIENRATREEWRFSGKYAVVEYN